MKLDDRFMAILTMLLLLIGGGAVLQSGDGSIFGRGGSYEPRPDAFTLRAGRVQSLDVLLNDLNADRIDPVTVKLMQAPTCGVALAVNGAIQYSESETCSGEVKLSYCVPYDNSCDITAITLTLLQNDDLSRPVAAANADGSPVIVDVIQMGAAPQAPGAVVAARPARLSMPTDSEVITPSAATAEVRRIGEESGRSMVAAAGSDSAVSVSNTSARSGRVATSGISMAAPDPAGESSGISVASGSTDSSPRGTAPAAPGGLAVAGVTPQSPAASFTRPDRPDAAVTANVAQDAPSSLAAPSVGEEGSPEVAVAATSRPLSPNAATQSEMSTGQDVAIAPSAQTSDPARLSLNAVPLDNVPDRIASLPAAPDTERATPDVARPSAAAAAVTVETADTARPAAPATPGGPAVLSERDQIQVARLSEGDSAAAQGAARTPVQPSEVERIGRAPDAQVVQPSGPEAPLSAEEESGVLASLARSNTFLGATFSAAKALFGPSETTPAVQNAPAGATAPRPAGSDEAPFLAEAPPAQNGETGPAVLSANGPDENRRAIAGPQVEVAALTTDTDAYVPKTKPAEGALSAFMRESGAVLIEEGSAAKDVEVAALPGGSDAAAGDAAAPAAQGVRLALPEIATGTGVEAVCDVRIGLQVQVGAEIIATVYSGCRPDTQFLVEHGGLVFSALTDIDGVANFVVPAMESEAEVTVTFPDGASASERALVEGMTRMTRVAVIWSDDIPFDLHAREFGAEPGSPGDVWAGNARNYRLARRNGGGYHMNLGPQSGQGVRAEVYTLFESLRTDEGVVEFEVSLGAPSDACTATPVIRVVRSETTSIVQNRDIAIDPAACAGAQLTDLGTGLQDILIAKSQ